MAAVLKWLLGSIGGRLLMLSISILVSAHILHVKSLKAENAMLASNNSKLITAAEAKAVANMPDKEKDIEEQVRARVEAQVKPWKEKYDTLEASYKETSRLYESEKISNAFTRSRYASEKLANLALAQDLFGGKFGIKDGTIVARDSKGEPIYGADGIASFDEALAKLVEESPYRDHLLKGSAASGSGAGQPGRHGSSNPNPWKAENRNVTEQQRILAENPSLAKTFMQQAGVPLPASMAKL